MKFAFSLTAQLLLGLLFGLALAFFLPDFAKNLAPLGNAFVMLMQMPVLLFLICSMVVGINKLSFKDAKWLFYYCLIFLLISFFITHLSIFLIPNAFPYFFSINQFSSDSLVQYSFDLTNIFIPENPFKSLSAGNISSIIVFAIFFAFAILKVKKAKPLIDTLNIIKDASIVIAQWISRFAFIGAIGLSSSFVINFESQNVPEIKYYYYAFIFGTVFISSIIIPLFISAIIPISFLRIIKAIFPSLLLAFISGNAIITFPLLLQALEKCMADYQFDKNKYQGFINTLLPLTLIFPISSKLFNILFIYFAGWYYADNIAPDEVVKLASWSLLTTFYSAPEGISFLLEQVQLPKDAVDMFIPTLNTTNKFLALASIASISALCFFTISSWHKKLCFKATSMASCLITAMIGYGAWFWLIHHQIPPTHNEIANYLSLEIENPAIFKTTNQDILEPILADDLLQDIYNNKALKLGFTSDNPPFAYKNLNQDIVGFNIELAHIFAHDLGVQLVLIPLNALQIVDNIWQRKIHLGLIGYRPEHNNNRFYISDPYITSSFVLVAKDYMLDKINENNLAKNIITTNNMLYFAQKKWPQTKQITLIKALDDYLKFPSNNFLLCSTLEAQWFIKNHPQYGIKNLNNEKTEMVFISPVDDAWLQAVNQWISKNRLNNTIDKLYNKWVLQKL